MKTLLLLAALLPLALLCRAQTPNPKQSPAYIYGQLGGPDITTGVLQERTIVLTDPADYNGTADSLCEFDSWHDLYTQLYHGSLSQGALFTPDTLYRFLRGSFFDHVPLIISHYRYNALLPNAEELGLIAFDSASGRYYDIPNRSQSPYTEGQVFSVALPTNKWNDSTGVTYFISQDYWLGNTPAPASLDIDFGDGMGYRTVAMNSTIRITYPLCA